MYDTDEEYPPKLPTETARLLEARGVRRERYLVLNHREGFGRGLSELCGMVAAGKLVAQETRWSGLDDAPAAFCGMMAGGNTGKALVTCAGSQRLAAMEALRRTLPSSLKAFLAARLATPDAFRGI